MNYKLGDAVRVRKDMYTYSASHGLVYVSPAMRNMGGRLGYVVRVNPGFSATSPQICVLYMPGVPGDSRCRWASDMLRPITGKSAKLNMEKLNDV